MVNCLIFPRMNIPTNVKRKCIFWYTDKDFIPQRIVRGKEKFSFFLIKKRLYSFDITRLYCRRHPFVVWLSLKGEHILGVQDKKMQIEKKTYKYKRERDKRLFLPK